MNKIWRWQNYMTNQLCEGQYWNDISRQDVELRFCGVQFIYQDDDMIFKHVWMFERKWILSYKRCCLGDTTPVWTIVTRRYYNRILYTLTNRISISLHNRTNYRSKHQIGQLASWTMHLTFWQNLWPTCIKKINPRGMLCGRIIQWEKHSIPA